MTTKAIFWALEQKGLKPTEQVILIRLADHANKTTFDPDQNTYHCRVRQKLLADECSISVSTFQENLKKLVKKGFISVENRFSADGYRVASMYKLHVNASAEQIIKDPEMAYPESGYPCPESGYPIPEKQGDGYPENRVMDTPKSGQHRNQENNQRETAQLSPDFEKIKKDPEQITSTRKKFAMFAGWTTDQETFAAYCAGAGVDPGSITDHQRNEFVRHWSGEQIEKTQAQWENKFLQSLIYQRSRSSQSLPQPSEPVELLSDDEKKARAEKAEREAKQRELAQEIAHLKDLISKTAEGARAGLRKQLLALEGEFAGVSDAATG